MQGGERLLLKVHCLYNDFCLGMMFTVSVRRVGSDLVAFCIADQASMYKCSSEKLFLHCFEDWAADLFSWTERKLVSVVFCYSGKLLLHQVLSRVE